MTSGQANQKVIKTTEMHTGGEPLIDQSPNILISEMTSGQANQKVIKTTEMHTGGEPLRIVATSEQSWPIDGSTILEKRKYFKSHLDHIRRTLMSEPRGHKDMYGALLVDPDDPQADMAALFIHNEGYSTMCGHAVIALARYAVDNGYVTRNTEGNTMVNIQCPCGLVKASLNPDNETSFISVPAFVYATDVQVGNAKVDISYGGAFYAITSAKDFDLAVEDSSQAEFIAKAKEVTGNIDIKIEHPVHNDLSFLYGVIFTDGQNQKDILKHVCVFGDGQIDRSPTGSGVTARMALMCHYKQVNIGQKKTFKSIIDSEMRGRIVDEVKYHGYDAVTVEVSGKAYYTGTSTFWREKDDPLRNGFLVR